MRYICRKHAGICNESKKSRSVESQLLPQRTEGEQISEQIQEFDYEDGADSCSDSHETSNIEEPPELIKVIILLAVHSPTQIVTTNYVNKSCKPH